MSPEIHLRLFAEDEELRQLPPQSGKGTQCGKRGARGRDGLGHAGEGRASARMTLPVPGGHFSQQARPPLM